MSGWGVKDDKTSTGTIALSTAGAVTGTSTTFTSEAAVGDILTANSIDFRITAIASDTACTVVDADTPGAAIVAQSAGAQYTLSEKPAGIIKASSGGTLTSETVFGVDETEQAAARGDNKGIAQSGWVAVKTVASGRITAIDTVGAADASRAEGTYILDPSMYSTASSGDGARFQIDVASNGAATVTVLNPGSGFADNEVITVADAQLGGGGGAALTFAVNGIESRKQYETLVALADGSASTMGDAEDTEFPDS